jgi:hypothetical protein
LQLEEIDYMGLRGIEMFIGFPGDLRLKELEGIANQLLPGTEMFVRLPLEKLTQLTNQIYITVCYANCHLKSSLKEKEEHYTLPL